MKNIRKPSESLHSSPAYLSSKLIGSLEFELRTLLNGFVGPIQLLKYKFENHDLVDIFRMLDSTVMRMERIAERSSLISAIDNQNHTQDMEELDIVDLTRFSILGLQSFSELEDISIEITGDPSPITINAHREMLLQAFNVLFENAVTSSAQSSSIKVSFWQEQSQGFCSLESDNVVFPKSLSTSQQTSMEQTNTPWDLLLAKALFQLHGVSVEVKTKGCCLTLCFPDVLS